MKNGEESSRNRTRKRYGNASAWIFSTETISLTNFERILNTRRAENFYSALFPLFIGEKKEVIAAQLAQASWVASTRRHRLLLEPPERPKWVWLLFAPPFLLNTPPFAFFGDSFFHNITKLYEFCNDTCFLSVRLRNLTSHVITPFLAFGM